MCKAVERQKGATYKSNMSYNQEAGSQKYSFHLHIHIQWELDAEVVCVCEDFLQNPAPLLADATNGLPTVFSLELQNRMECRWFERN